jgi:hypothetical protein
MRMRCLLAAILLAWSAGVVAQPHSVRECREGGDFIRNAALSRDGGTTREFFVGRLEEDLLTIRAFPPDLRWFVHDQDDERFLRAEVEAVFDAPESSEQHRAGFLERCARRAAQQVAPST